MLLHGWQPKQELLESPRAAFEVFARRPDRHAWCGPSDAQFTRPPRRTGLSEARLSLGSLRRSPRRADRGQLNAHRYIASIEPRASSTRCWPPSSCSSTSTRSVPQSFNAPAAFLLIAIGHKCRDCRSYRAPSCAACTAIIVALREVAVRQIALA